MWLLLFAITQMAQGADNATTEWWQEPVRMLRVDYAPDFAILKDMDLDAVARSHKEDWQINCEWVMGSFGWEGRGDLTCFKTACFETWPGFGEFDYLRSYLPHAHKYGIHLLAYLNMHWFSYAFSDNHPGWEQMRSDGRAYGRVNPLYGNGTTFCVNSPWRDWAMTMIREAMRTGIDGVFLDGPVIYPDCCYCESCQKKFKEEFGKEIPTEDWQNPLWRDFVDFREESMAHFLADAQKAVREINPKGVVFLNAGSWNPGDWRVARNFEILAPYQTFSGSEAFFHHGTSQYDYASLITGKCLRAGGNPAVVFSHYMNGSWHYRVLDPNEVKLELVQTVSCGANPWLALVYSSMKSQPEASKPVKEIFSFLEENKEFYTQTESVAEVALLFSSVTGRNYLSQLNGVYQKTGSGKEEDLIADVKKEQVTDTRSQKRLCEQIIGNGCRGYFDALTRMHVPFDIILDKDLTTETLRQYKLLVMPDSVCLKNDAAAAVTEFVIGGGALIASFESGFYDGRGQYTGALLNVLGIDSVDGAFPVARGDNYVQAMQEHWGFPKDALIERGPYALKVKAQEGVETPEQFLNPVDQPYMPLNGLSPNPALLVNNYGRGHVVYFPEAIGAFFAETHMTTAEQRIDQAVAQLLKDPMVEIDAPKTVSVEAFRRADTGQLVIHLVNNTVDTRPVNEFLPVFDIKISIKSGGKSARVQALREHENVQTSVKQDRLVIRLPKLSLYEVIAVDLPKS